MNEETINKFTIGATVEVVYVFEDQGQVSSIHVILDNGAMIAIHGDIHGVEVLGPGGEPIEAQP